MWFNLITLRARGFSPTIYSTLKEKKAMYTTSLACATTVSSKGHDQSQIGLASNLMWQNPQLPVMCEDSRPHSLFSRHSSASAFATFTFCISLSSHLLSGVGFSRPTCLMEACWLSVKADTGAPSSRYSRGDFSWFETEQHCENSHTTQVCCNKSMSMKYEKYEAQLTC